MFFTHVFGAIGDVLPVSLTKYHTLPRGPFQGSDQVVLHPMPRTATIDSHSNVGPIMATNMQAQALTAGRLMLDPSI